MGLAFFTFTFAGHMDGQDKISWMSSSGQCTSTCGCPVQGTIVYRNRVVLWCYDGFQPHTRHGILDLSGQALLKTHEASIEPPTFHIQPVHEDSRRGRHCDCVALTWCNFASDTERVQRYLVVSGIRQFHGSYKALRKTESWYPIGWSRACRNIWQKRKIKNII